MMRESRDSMSNGRPFGDSGQSYVARGIDTAAAPSHDEPVRLMLEVEGEGPAPDLPGGGAALIALMSFAVVRGFGAQHPLIALADRLHDTHRVRLGPLTTFYDAQVEDAEDVEKLELAWQDAADLRQSLEGLVTVLETDETGRALARRADAEDLAPQAAALLETVRRAADAGKRVRLVYAL